MGESENDSQLLALVVERAIEIDDVIYFFLCRSMNANINELVTLLINNVYD